MKNKNKKIVQAGVVIIAALMIVPSGSAIITDKDLSLVSEKVDSINLDKENIIALNGTIKAEWVTDSLLRNQWLGLITPSINLSENQTLQVNVEKGENETYYVNSTLQIEVEVIGNASRLFLFGRSIMSAISIIKEEKSILPLRGLLQRWFIGKLLTVSKTNVDKELGVNETGRYIEIPLYYEIDNETEMENVSMHILVWGMFPGNAYPGLDRVSIIEYAKLNLEFVYIY